MQPHAITVGPSTRTEGLADRMRGDIATNIFAPGARITETALAEAYGVSRTPVREALRALVQEQLLEYKPNWGYQVTRLDLVDLDDLYALRIAIEQQSVRRLAEGKGDLTVVAELLEVWDLPPHDVPSDVNLVFADEAFHETLAAAAGGTVLLDSLRSINRRIHPVRMREFIDPERVARTVDQHVGILRAVLEADARLAVALMTSHVLEGQRYVRLNALALDLVQSSTPRGGRA